MPTIACRGSSSSVVPSIQLYSVTPPTYSTHLGVFPVSSAHGSLDMLESTASHHLRLQCAPLHGHGPLYLQDAQDATHVCQASIPALRLHLCASSGSVRIFDEEPGTFPLLHTLHCTFAVKTLAAACVTATHPTTGVRREALLVACGGLAGVQLHLWGLQPYLVARGSSGGGGGGAGSAAAKAPSSHRRTTPTTSYDGKSGAGGGGGGGGGGGAPHPLRESTLVEPLQPASLDLLRGISVGHCTLGLGGGILAVATGDGRIKFWDTPTLVSALMLAGEVRRELHRSLVKAHVHSAATAAWLQ